MSMVEKVRAPRLAESIAQHLEGLILEGALRPGERLIAERDLAVRLDVSRPSLREALGLLEQRGLLETTKSGTVVAQFLSSISDPLSGLLQTSERSVDDYFEYRMIIDAAAARLAAERGTEVDHAAIADCLSRMEDAHLLNDPKAEASADADLHLLIYEATHNLIILHVMRALSGLLRNDVFQNRRRLYARSTVREELLAQHRAIAAAIIARDAKKSERVAHEHVRFTFETMDAIRRDEARVEVALRRLGRGDLVAS